MFKDLERRRSFRSGSINYVVREKRDGRFKIRIRAANYKILVESDNDYDSIDDAEKMLALIHDNAVRGNAVVVHKPPEDAEDDQT